LLVRRSICNATDLVLCFLRGLTECEGWSPQWFDVAVPRFLFLVNELSHAGTTPSNVSLLFVSFHTQSLFVFAFSGFD